MLRESRLLSANFFKKHICLIIQYNVDVCAERLFMKTSKKAQSVI